MEKKINFTDEEIKELTQVLSLWSDRNLLQNN